MTLGNFPRQYIFAALLVACCASLLKASRFFLLLRAQDLHVHPFGVLKLFVASQATSALPAGEALRGLLVKLETGVEGKKTMAPVFLQMFYEGTTAAVIALMGSLALDTFIVPSLISLVILGTALALALNFEHVTKFTKGRAWLRHLENLAKETGPSIQQSMKPAHRVIIQILLGGLSHAVIGLILFIILRGLHIDLPYLTAVYIAGVSVVLQTFGGIIPGGLGVTEGGMLGVFLALGISAQASLPAILLFRAMTLLFFITLGVCVFIIFYGKTFLKPHRRRT